MVHSFPCDEVCQSLCAGPGFRYIQIPPKPGAPFFTNADYVLSVQCAPCENCNISCVTGDQNEGEPNCTYGYVDVTNGGPLAASPAFSPTLCGNAICGTSGLFMSPSGWKKDQDWYQVTLSQTRTLRWCVYARFAPTLAIRGPGGSGFVTYAFSSANAACDTACVEACLGPGTYWLFVEPTIFADYAGLAPCGSRYRAWVTCTPCGGEPLGRCCYCDPQSLPQCAVNTESQCAALGGEWTSGLTCAVPCPSHAQVRFETVPVTVQCVDGVLTPDPFPLGLSVHNYGPTTCNNVVVSVGGGTGPGGTATILGSPVTYSSLAPFTGSSPNITAQLNQANSYGGCINFTASVSSSCCGRDTIAFCIQIPPCDTCDYEDCDRNTEPLNDVCGQDHCFVTCADTLCGSIDPTNNPDWYLFNNPGPNCQQISISVFATATPGYFPSGQGLIPSLAVYDASCVFQEASDTGNATHDPSIQNLCLPPGLHAIQVTSVAPAPNGAGPYILALSRCIACVCTCRVDCDDLGLPFTLEGEPCPNLPDNFNAGCNATPPVFQPHPSNAAGRSVCGTAFNNGSLRDTDWYVRTVNFWNSRIRWSVRSEFPTQLYVMRPNGPCPGLTLVAQAATNTCGQTATIDLNLCSPSQWGSYYFFIAPLPSQTTPCADYVSRMRTRPCFWDGLVAARSANSIRLNWPSDPDSSVLTFLVYRATTPGILGDLIAATTDTTYLDEGVVTQPEARYFYTITVQDNETIVPAADDPATIVPDDGTPVMVPSEWTSTAVQAANPVPPRRK